MLKRNHHVELLIRPFGNEILCHLYIGHRAFADSETVIMVINITLEFIKILFKMRSVLIVLNARCNRQRESVRQTLLL